MPNSLLRRAAGLSLAAALLTSAAVVAAELQDRTSRAYAAYREDAEARFLARARGEVRVDHDRGTIRAGAAHEDGIIGVPGGLVHHWSGTAFVAGARLRTAIEVSQRYPSYESFYREILVSRLIERDDDTFRVLMRLKGGDGGVTAVLDVRSTVRYIFPTEGRAITLSHADEIREVRHAGSHNEQLLPSGRDSGYLWRANVFTLLVETGDGVYVETETLGLSRSFPPLLGWLIEPIARRLGRRSVEHSLEQFRAAVLSAREDAPDGSVVR